MRLCPKCSAYYADGVTAFCLVDGMPLVSVDPGSDNWTEGTRVIEEKETALKKRQRKLRWRWIVMTAMTALILTMVVVSSVTVETTAPPCASPPPCPSPSPPPLVYKISGRVTSNDKPLGGVGLTLKGPAIASTTTDANGNYVFSNLPEGSSYTVTPARGTMEFTPPSLPINSLRKDESADFIGREQIHLYRISGRVTSNGRPLGDVELTLKGPSTASTMTDANGNYVFSDLAEGGSYTVTPARGTMEFTPRSQPINSLRKNESADFIGREQIHLYKISGRVTSNGEGLGGVNITLCGGKSESTTTAPDGTYIFSGVPAGGSYTITPDPKVKFPTPSRIVKNLTKDESVNFSRDTPPRECTDADQDRERQAIINKFGARWQQQIKSNPPKVNTNGSGVRETPTLGPIEYQSTFLRNCTAAVVTARYVWEVTGPAGSERVPKEKRFTCVNLGGTWICN